MKKKFKIAFLCAICGKPIKSKYFLQVSLWKATKTKKNRVDRAEWEQCVWSHKSCFNKILVKEAQKKTYGD
jgi:ribosomal protein L34E